MASETESLNQTAAPDCVTCDFTSQDKFAINSDKPYFALLERIYWYAYTKLIKHNLYAMPVDVEELAKKENCEIVGKRFSNGLEGACVALSAHTESEAGDHHTIYIDWTASESRRRRTIAHELGHIFYEELHKLDENTENDTEDNACPKIMLVPRKDRASREIYSDWFAACILLPFRLFFNETGNILRDKGRSFSQWDLFSELGNSFNVEPLDVALAFPNLRLLAVLKPEGLPEEVFEPTRETSKSQEAKTPVSE